MSITFYCPLGSSVKKPCSFCEMEDVDFPDGNKYGGRCDALCDGFQMVPEAPEVNFSNYNARNLLQLMGISGGELEHGQMTPGKFRQHILRARNSDRGSLVEAPVSLPGGHQPSRIITEDGQSRIASMGAAYVYTGNTDEKTLERLDRLETLALWAQKRGYGISWS